MAQKPSTGRGCLYGFLDPALNEQGQGYFITVISIADTFSPLLSFPL